LPRADAFAGVDAARKDWLSGKTVAADLPAKEWNTLEWVRFLDGMPQKLPAAKLADLDAAYALSTSGNAEISLVWLKIAIRNDYAAAYAKLESHLTTIGRQRLIKPLYEELLKTPAGAERARAIYLKARPNYHPIATTALDKLLLRKTGS
jgi:leukotriene-A4 hydrolase